MKVSPNLNPASKAKEPSNDCKRIENMISINP